MKLNQCPLPHFPKVAFEILICIVIHTCIFNNPGSQKDDTVSLISWLINSISTSANCSILAAKYFSYKCFLPFLSDEPLNFYLFELGLHEHACPNQKILIPFKTTKVTISIKNGTSILCSLESSRHYTGIALYNFTFKFTFSFVGKVVRHHTNVKNDTKS